MLSRGSIVSVVTGREPDSAEPGCVSIPRKNDSGTMSLT